MNKITQKTLIFTLILAFLAVFLAVGLAEAKSAVGKSKDKPYLKSKEDMYNWQMKDQRDILHDFEDYVKYPTDRPSYDLDALLEWQLDEYWNIRDSFGDNLDENWRIKNPPKRKKLDRKRKEKRKK